ncbi:MAG: DNA polymerase III subunit delta [Sedimentisphaerales bacterium]|nr:DNA polymerase III subunit delta [Sedimentisphaerales bacterium]
MATKKVQPGSDAKPIYVIAGKDDFLLGQQCQSLLDTLIDPAQRQTDLFDVDPDKASITDVLDELRTVSFFTGRRVALIKNADDFISDNREPLERYFDNPIGPGILVLTVKGWPKTTKLAKKLDGVGELISVAEFKKYELPQFAIARAATYGKAMSKATAEMLVELVGDELGRVSSEVDKLATFADAQKTITTAHVEALIGHNRLYNAFAVIDAMTAGDIAAAVERLRMMFAADKSAEYTVVGAFAFQFRRMFSAKALLAKGNGPREVMSKLRLWGDTDSFFKQLSKMTLAQTGSLLQELAHVDYAIKTGRSTAPVAMEQLVLRLASTPR